MMNKGVLSPCKRPFFGIMAPKIQNSLLPDISAGPAEEAPAPRSAVHDVPGPYDGEKLLLKRGEAVKRGQPVTLYAGDGPAFTATVCGLVSTVEPAVSHDGRKITRVKIEASGQEDWDEGPGADAGLTAVAPYICSLPGGLDPSLLKDLMHPVHRLVILALDTDPLSTAVQQVCLQKSNDIASGIAALKKLTGAGKVEAAAFSSTAKTAATWDVPVVPVSNRYPDCLPKLICKNHFGTTISAGAGPNRHGIAFVSAESAAALGALLRTGRAKGEKVVTLVSKDLSEKSVNFKARIGAPIRDVLATGRVVVAENDRVVLGGPFTGYAAADLDEPVTPFTGSIMVQDEGDIFEVSDSACFNCGECVRVCPAKMPVNMLVRYLENGMWDEAARRYDLLSCVECGLCSFVCPARIPVFQQIMLGWRQYENSLTED